jgi:predicted TPR repeat methyltransferase
MPRSIVEGKAWISHEIARLRPTTLLDVGPGMGTYSNLLRDVTPGASWSCVEVFQPYVQLFDLQSKYDTIHCADIRYFSWPTVYDVVILGDVLEHLTLADALTVWSTARANARYIALSIPIIEYPQGAQHGNVHEAHMHAWSHDMVLSELAGVWRWQVNPKIGAYLARGTLDVSS